MNLLTLDFQNLFSSLVFHNSSYSGLEYFYPRMTQGGVIIIHDCNNEFSGSKKALDEFFLDKPETPIIIPDKSGSAIVVKLKA